jgi:hypothetical protein
LAVRQSAVQNQQIQSSVFAVLGSWVEGLASLSSQVEQPYPVFSECVLDVMQHVDPPLASGPFFAPGRCDPVAYVRRYPSIEMIDVELIQVLLQSITSIIKRLGR